MGSFKMSFAFASILDSAVLKVTAACLARDSGDFSLLLLSRLGVAMRSETRILWSTRERRAMSKESRT